jgi:hypothetical protein
MNAWDTHRWIGSNSGRSVKIDDQPHHHLFCVICGRNFSLHLGKLDRLGKRLLRRLVLLEPRHRGGLILWQIALWIDRGLPAFR